MKEPEEKKEGIVDAAERKEIRTFEQTKTDRNKMDEKLQLEDSRKHLDKLYMEYNKKLELNKLSVLTFKKIVLFTLVIVEIMALCCWVHNPIVLTLDVIIAPILLLGFITALIFILISSILREDKERVKLNREMEKELFMRRLK